MSGPGPDPALIFGQGATPLVPDGTCWQWDTTTDPPSVVGYPVGVSSAYPSGFAPTKTGLTPTDLQNFIGVPLQYYGNPPTPVTSGTVQGWIRYAEDKVEQETSLLLCQTWIASPPAQQRGQAESIGLILNNPLGYQKLGLDYDKEDAAYDFMFPRAQDEGWMYQTLRYRPVQSLTYNVSGSPTTAGFSAVKNIAYIYPLLNTFFRVPPSWIVEDRSFGLIRLVPAQNVQMLPLFAMQLAFMGFAESVPGALWFQYCAGLVPNDYVSAYSFVKELVLCEASLTALTAIQGTINLGMKESQLTVDGLSYRVGYDVKGPYAGLIAQFKEQRDYLMRIARSKLAGPMLNVI
jgi:hypothetical protein